MDALDFLKSIDTAYADVVLYVIWSYMILIAVLLCYNRNSDYTDLRMPVKVKMQVSQPLTGILKSAEIQISDRSKAVIVQSRSRLQIIDNGIYSCPVWSGLFFNVAANKGIDEARARKENSSRRSPCSSLECG